MDIPNTMQSAIRALKDIRIDYLTVHISSGLEALKAVKKAIIKYETLKPIITIKDALKKNSYISKPTEVKKGNPLKKISEAKHSITGNFKTGAQDHLYLEPL